MTRMTCLLLSLGTLISIVGCGSKQNGTLGTFTAEAPKLVSSGPPVTIEEAKAFAAEFEAKVAEGDVEAVSKLLRIEDIAERSISDLNAPASFMKGFKNGFARSKNSIAITITDTVAKGGSYKLLRIRDVSGTPKPQFRLLNADSALNYHEFTLARFPDGKIGTADLHLASTGEPLSQSFRRMIIPLLSESKQGSFDRLSSKDKMYLEHMPKLSTITALQRQGENQKALNLLRTFPEQLQKEKSLLVVAIMLSQNVSDDEYIKEMGRFRELYPNDSAVDILSIDFFGMKKQFEQSHACIDRLNQAIGGDPYLLYAHGSVDVMSERWKEAADFFNKAKKADPTMVEPYWGDVTISLKQQNHTEALKGLKILVEKFNVELDIDIIQKDDNYKEFAKSPQFGELSKWLAAR